MKTPETEPRFPSPDPELFRRVWNRVMAEAPLPASGSSALPAPLPCPKPEVPPPCGDRDFLVPLMELSARRTAALRALARRGGSAAGSLSAMASDCRADFCRLSTAHFLITGQRYRPGAVSPALPRDLGLALRDRWLECIRWKVLCETACQATEEPVLSHLLQEMGREGTGHAALLRSLLEKRCPPP